MDDVGNITSRKEDTYTTGILGTVVDTIAYTYGDSAWGDLQIGYNGKTITSDTFGYVLSADTWIYTEEHIRKQITISIDDVLR